MRRNDPKGFERVVDDLQRPIDPDTGTPGGVDERFVPPPIPHRYAWIWGLWEDLDGDRGFAPDGSRGATSYLAVVRRMEDAGLDPARHGWVAKAIREIDRGFRAARAEAKPDDVEERRRERASQVDALDSLRRQHLDRHSQKPSKRRDRRGV